MRLRTAILTALLAVLPMAGTARAQPDEFLPADDMDATLSFEMADEGPTCQAPAFYDESCEGEFEACAPCTSDSCCQWWHDCWAPWLDSLELAPLSERWSDRTWHAGLFLGAWLGDGLIDQRVDQGNGAAGGLRLGCDLDISWGAEVRLLAAAADVTNAQPPDNLRSGNVDSADLCLVFYPWTTPRFRPFVLTGVGLAVFDFGDENGRAIDRSTPQFPLGLGFKYRHDDWVAFRIDLTDNIALGNGPDLSTMHNVSLTGGVEFRFGGHRKSWWPWQRRRKSW